MIKLLFLGGLIMVKGLMCPILLKIQIQKMTKFKKGGGEALRHGSIGFKSGELGGVVI